MFNKLIRFVVKIENFSRYYFWRAILYFNGSSLGRNVTIHRHVKLASQKNRPIHIGDNVKIMQGVIISTAQEGKVSIGSDVYIGEYSIITSNKEIIIEDNVMIAPHNNIVDFDHESNDFGTAKSQTSFTAKKITIQKGSWIASNCCVLKGVTIGEKATIGAGTIVTKDIPSGSVAVINSACAIKRSK